MMAMAGARGVCGGGADKGLAAGGGAGRASGSVGALAATAWLSGSVAASWPCWCSIANCRSKIKAPTPPQQSSAPMVSVSVRRKLLLRFYAVQCGGFVEERQAFEHVQRFVELVVLALQIFQERVALVVALFAFDVFAALGVAQVPRQLRFGDTPPAFDGGQLSAFDDQIGFNT